MKHTQVRRPVRRVVTTRKEDPEAQELLPLTAREFLKLSVVPRLHEVRPRGKGGGR